ncbi:hypothetical protein AG1IA_05034 [Rhizoctonia solani AG-1 IA]|uniref:Uncharacterized protein n=1 Tax=Thanatephorus cucumeris (strain AG1-IA) TaxID=983506 RepID=L8WX62_THACA|nr:hypothetical protein AG1IA_05034 [Rhizoctonia solani AG-1 IA]
MGETFFKTSVSAAYVRWSVFSFQFRSSARRCTRVLPNKVEVESLSTSRGMTNEVRSQGGVEHSIERYQEDLYGLKQRCFGVEDGMQCKKCKAATRDMYRNKYLAGRSIELSEVSYRAYRGFGVI